MKVSAINSVKCGTNVQNLSFEKKSSKGLDEYILPKEYSRPVGYSASIIASGLGVMYGIKHYNATPYAKIIAKNLSEACGKKVSPNSLSCLMDGEELLSILPKLKKQNYEFSPENVKNGIFQIDLHSHSKYSDGNGYVKNILEDAAEYADKLYKQTKQKFIFALTDHDTVDGVKEALEIISSNPQRYKNLRFVPGIEISFAHKATKSQNSCEVSELLVYGINPYSENINKFLNNIKQKRINMVNKFIEEAFKKCPLTNFSYEEFSKYYDLEKYGNIMNLHWRAYHYIQTKHAITNHASRINHVADNLYGTIMNDMKGASVGLLKERGKIADDINEAPEFFDIHKQLSPHFEKNKLIAAGENTFEEVIEAFKDEKNIFMAFAHPYYFTEHLTDYYKTLQNLVANSKGLIKASESYHQAYNPFINRNVLEKLQSETESLNLLNLGGRDNHNEKLF